MEHGISWCEAALARLSGMPDWCLTYHFLEGQAEREHPPDATPKHPDAITREFAGLPGFQTELTPTARAAPKTCAGRKHTGFYEEANEIPGFL